MCLTLTREDQLVPDRKSGVQTAKKLLMAILVIALIFFNSLHALHHKSPEPSDTEDKTFVLIKVINEYLITNKTAIYVLLIVSSVSLDVLMVGFFVYWVKASKTWRAPIAMIIYEILRMGLQFLYHTPTTKGHITYDSTLVIPSLTMIYLNNSTHFFLPIVIGVPVIISLELKNMNCKKSAITSLLILLIEVFHLVATRMNTIVEILSALMIAHYTYVLTEGYSQYLDKTRLSLKDEVDLLDREDYLI